MATVSGDVDLSTHEGQLMARIQGAVARKESDDKSRRIRRKHEELADAGKASGGGSRPYGYEEDKVTIRQDEAEVVRELASRVLAGDSLKALCRDFSARGITTAQGKEWSTAGDPADAVVGPDQRPARAPWRDRGARRSGRRSLRRRRRRSCARSSSTPTGARTGPAGATCCRAFCVAATAERSSTRGHATITSAATCARSNFGGCGRITVLADPVELFVSEAVLHRLESPLLAGSDHARPGRRRRGPSGRPRPKQAQAQLDELIAMWAATRSRAASGRRPAPRSSAAATRPVRSWPS